jgi:hypothetical protein
MSWSTTDALIWGESERVENEKKMAGRDERVFQNRVRRVRERGCVVW